VRIVNDPNAFQTGVKFWQQCGTYEELTGESYVWVVNNGAGVPVELWILPSQWMVPRCDGLSGKLVDYFECRSTSGPVEYFEPDEIIWSKNDSPWHPLQCTSRVQNASTTIDAYDMTETARYTGLENGTMIGGVFSYPADVNVTQVMVDRLEARLLAKNGGPGNAQRPFIADGGLEWTPPTGELELAFMQSSDQLRKYIMAHFGLDESMMGFAQHATYAGAVITKEHFSVTCSVPGWRTGRRR
jgi:phage portal protein BeeE